MRYVRDQVVDRFQTLPGVADVFWAVTLIPRCVFQYLRAARSVCIGTKRHYLNHFCRHLELPSGRLERQIWNTTYAH